MLSLICDTAVVMDSYKTQDNAVKLLNFINDNRRAGVFNDVEICIDSDSFLANRMVLSCFSEYFKRMFKVELKEKHQKSVEIKGVDKSSMKTIIEFIYTGSVQVNSGNVYDLLAAADYLQVNDLTEFCFQFLKSVVTPENSFDAFAIANRYENKMLKEHATNVIGENFDIASSTNGFKGLSQHDLLSWLSNRGESCEESLLFNALIKWARYEENHALVFQQVFQHISFDKLSRKFIENVVLKEELVLQSSEVCKRFLKEFNDRLRILEQGSDKQQSQATQTTVNMEKFTLLSLGGTDKGDKLLEIMNFCEASPKTYPDLPVKRKYGCSVVLYDCIYNIGGDILRRESRNLTTKTVWRMNMKEINLKWSKVCSLKEPRSFIGAASLSGVLVVAGGETVGTHNHLATAEAYTPIGNTWKNISSLNQCRSQHVLVACNDCLYAIGGVGNFSGIIWPLYSVECLTTIDHEWKIVMHMQTSRKCLAAVNCNGFIYAIGGKSWHSNRPLSSVEKYDPKNNKWTYVKDMNFQRLECAASVIQGRIVVVGGLDGDGDVVTKIESYDPLFDTWSIVGETQDDLYYHSLVVV